LQFPDKEQAMSVEKRVSYYLSNDDYHEATRELFRGMTNLTAANSSVAEGIYSQIREQIEFERSLRDNPGRHDHLSVSLELIQTAMRNIASQIDVERNKTPLTEFGQPNVVELDRETRKHFESINLERQLNRQTLKAIGWLKQGLTMAKSVCRIGIRESDYGVARFFGTGVLLYSGWLLTSKRNIFPGTVLGQSASEYLPKIVCQFGYDDYYLGPPTGEIIQYVADLSDAILPLDDALDCVLLKLRPDSKASSKRDLTNWGGVIAGNDNPRVKDFVPVIQHPDGEAKQISVNSNEIVKVNQSHVWYTSDTERNSSGAPIFNEDWRFIGIHVSRGEPISAKSEFGREVYPNIGLRISRILQDKNMERGWTRVAW
jgi:Trypsin-like peptidase domain